MEPIEHGASLENIYDNTEIGVRKMNRLERILIKLGKVFLAIIIVGVVVSNILTLYWGRQYDAELRKLKASGAPVASSDLAGKSVPDDKNAAVVYQKIFARLKKDLPKDETALLAAMPGYNKERTQADFAAAGLIAPKYDWVVDMTEHAELRPECKFPVEWEKGFAAVSFPHFANMRQLTRVLCSKAIVHAREGRTQDATRCISLALRLQRRGDVNTLIAVLVRIAILKIGTASLMDVMHDSRLTEAQARTIYDALTQVNFRRYMVTAFEGERACYLGLADYAMRHGMSEAQAVMFLGKTFPEPDLVHRVYNRIILLPTRPIDYANGACYLKLMRKQIDAFRLPFYDPRSKRTMAEIDGQRVPFYAWSAEILKPVFSRAGVAAQDAQAEAVVAQASMALVAYKDRFGSYPEKLSDVESRLEWKISADPFSGKPLHYERRGTGFILYSIGANLRDEGGKGQPRPGARSDKGPDDVWWTMER